MASRSPPVSDNTCQVSEHLGDSANISLQPPALGFLGRKFGLAGIAAIEPGVQSENNDEQEPSSGSCLKRHENTAAGTDTVDDIGVDETPDFDKGSFCRLLHMAADDTAEDFQQTESCFHSSNKLMIVVVGLGTLLH